MFSILSASLLFWTLIHFFHNINIGEMTIFDIQEFFNNDKVFMFYMVLIISASMPTITINKKGD